MMEATRDWMLTIPASKFDKKEVENRLKNISTSGSWKRAKPTQNIYTGKFSYTEQRQGQQFFLTR